MLHDFDSHSAAVWLSSGILSMRVDNFSQMACLILHSDVSKKTRVVKVKEEGEQMYMFV